MKVQLVMKSKPNSVLMEFEGVSEFGPGVLDGTISIVQESKKLATVLFVSKDEMLVLDQNQIKGQ